MSQINTTTVSNSTGGRASFTNLQFAATTFQIDMTGTPFVQNSSFNVSSTADLGVGEIQVGFTNSYASAGDVCGIISSSYDSTYEGSETILFWNGTTETRTTATGALYAGTTLGATTPTDDDTYEFCGALYGDLA
jgi:hypothetical protein